MPDYFPMFVDLRGRRCLVVGGGPIAERKVRALLDCGARVIVVSPVVTADLAALARAGILIVRNREFRSGDVSRCAVVIAATWVPEVDTAVALAARRRRVLANVVDQPAECGFIFPSVLRRGELQIAVSTGGRSPALAREIRRHLEPLFGPDCADLVDEVGRERARARAVAGTPRERVEAGERVVELALGTMPRDDDAPGLVGRAIPRLVDDLIAAGSGALYVEAVRLLERAPFSHVLRMTGGNQLRAARALGLNRNTLRKRCRELGIEVGRRPPVSLSSQPPRASRYSSSV